MNEIERDVSIEQVDYNVDINTENYSIDILSQPTFELQLNEQGPQGARGYTGTGIAMINLDYQYGNVDVYRILMTDGTEYHFSVTNGLPGSTGNGIDYIAKTGSSGNIDTYTIYYTDGTNDTFNVTNGINGANGVGVQDVTLDYTSGLDDYYHMNFTDGTYYEYVVTNGANGTNGTNGYSPTATVSKVGDTATISITDINGTTTATITDGASGVTTLSGMTDVDLTNLANGQGLIYNAVTQKWENANITVNNVVDLTSNQTINGRKEFYNLNVTDGNNYGKVATVGGVYNLYGTNSPVSSGVIFGDELLGGNTLRENVRQFAYNSDTDEDELATIFNNANLIAGTNVTLTYDSGTGKYSINSSATPITVDQTYDGTSSNPQSGTAIAGAGFLTSVPSDYLKNTATATDAISVYGTSNTTWTNGINIGKGSSISSTNGVAIGVDASADVNSVALGRDTDAGVRGTAIGAYAKTSYDTGIAIGCWNANTNNAKSTAKGAYQFGVGTNNTARTLNIGWYDDSVTPSTFRNYQLLDGNTGLIPDARISSSFVKTTDIDQSYNSASTNPQSGTAVADAISDRQQELIQGDYIDIKPAVTIVVPTGYTQLEYISSASNSNIVTPLTGDIKWEITAQGNPPYPTQRFIVSCTNSTTGYAWFGSAGSSWGCTGGAVNNISVTTKADLVIDFSGTTVSGTVNGNSFTYTGASSIDGNWTLFGAPNGTGYKFYGYLYSAKATQNGNVVFNGIPCKRDLDDVCGLWDTVNNTFYPSNSSAFSAGQQAYDKPVISADVGDGTLTISRYGSTLATFKANAKTNTSCNINPTLASKEVATSSIINSATNKSANTLCFCGNDNLVHSYTETTVPISLAYGMFVNTSQLSANILSTWYYKAEKCSWTVPTALRTFTSKYKVWAKCTYPDANGRVYFSTLVGQDGSSNTLTGGYTYYYLGVANSTSIVALDTSGSHFLSIDTNGKLTHIDGIEIKDDAGGGGTVDQTYDATSANAQSGVAIAGAGFLTGITSGDVTSALGYTPYNSTNPNGYITSSALTGYQTTSNLVTAISASSTDAQYPSAKCVYDIVGDIETLLQAI